MFNREGFLVVHNIGRDLTAHANSDQPALLDSAPLSSLSARRARRSEVITGENETFRSLN